jgi:hypothetical protein
MLIKDSFIFLHASNFRMRPAAVLKLHRINSYDTSFTSPMKKYKHVSESIVTKNALPLITMSPEVLKEEAF